MENKRFMQIAVNLVPLISYLRKHGVISFSLFEDGDHGGVLMKEETFLEVFPEHEELRYKSTTGWGTEAFAFFEGVRFFALLENEKDGEEAEKE